MDQSFAVLTAIVLIPAFGAIAIALTPKSRVEIIKMFAVLFSVASGALSIWVLWNFDKADPGFQFVSNQEWIESFGISWSVGVDGISLFLVVLTGVLFPLAIVGVAVKKDEKAYFAWILLLMAGVMGVFVALDLFLFFVAFEVTLVPMYMLIGGWGHGERVRAATKFFLYTMFGSALMLVGILALVWLNQSATGELTFSLPVLAANVGDALSTTQSRIIFASFALAFAIKIPLFPVHTWLPDAHTEAPTAGSVILAGVLLKLGTYALLRFGFFLFPTVVVDASWILLTVGVIGVIYGAVVATMQKDLKRLIAYSSVAHMGFVVIGIAALNTEGVTGSVIQMVNHGVSTAALFLLVGMIYTRRHTRDISALSGLQKAAPMLAGVYMLVMLSSIGLPGLNGFVGEFLILQGTFLSGRYWAVVAAGGVILAALYLLWAYQRVFHGPAEGDNAKIRDLGVREALVMAPFLIAIVFVGVYPKPVLERIEPSVDAILCQVELRVDDFTYSSTEAGSQLDPEKRDRINEEYELDVDVERADDGAETGDEPSTPCERDAERMEILAARQAEADADAEAEAERAGEDGE